MDSLAGTVTRHDLATQPLLAKVAWQCNLWLNRLV